MNRIAKRGQAVVLLLALIVVFVALALWMVNIHHYVLRKLRAQDAGDAAALAMARWQAAGLNLVGELTLMHAYMLSDTDSTLEEAQAIYELQQRITLVTPMLALEAAQAAAKANGADPLPEAQAYLRDYAKTLAYDDTYPGSNEALQTMLERILHAGIYAFPAVASAPGNNNLLLNQDFYEAILARDWCWFWFNAYSFMQHYSGPKQFGPIGDLPAPMLGDLKLTTVQLALKDVQDLTLFNSRLQALDHPQLPSLPLTEAEAARVKAKLETPQPWFVYAPEAWGTWDELQDLPLRAEVRDKYDVGGVKTALSVSANGSSWLAAAKAFGEIEGEKVTLAGFPLGGFDSVRLIPVDAAGANLTTFNIAWLRHLYYHVQDFANRGLVQNNCRYCLALSRWQDAKFRQQGLDWLMLNGHTCRRPTSGEGDGGGSRYAH